MANSSLLVIFSALQCHVKSASNGAKYCRAERGWSAPVFCMSERYRVGALEVSDIFAHSKKCKPHCCIKPVALGVVGFDHGSRVEIDLCGLGQRGMRVGCEVGIGKESEGELIRMQFEQIPVWIRLSRNLRTSEGLFQGCREKAGRGLQNVKRPG